MSLGFKEIFIKSAPIALSYLILGGAFGAIFASKGGTPIEAFFISLSCYAGAAQFLAIEFYKADFSAWLLFASVCIINLRHIIYGLNLISYFPRGIVRIYLLSSLTDESFGISGLYDKEKLTKKNWMLIFGLNHFYWVFGCVLGSILNSQSDSFNRYANVLLVFFFTSVLANIIRTKRTA